MKIVDEVKKDFKIAISKIDFKSYNPNSTEFINALRIGKMWRLLTKLEEDEDEGSEIVAEEKESMYMIQENPKDEICKNLCDSKKYIQKYIETSNESMKHEAMESLNEAESLIKKGYSKLPNAEEKIKLRNYEHEHSEILKQLNSL